MKPRVIVGGVIPAILGPLIFWLMLRYANLSASELARHLTGLKVWSILVIIAGTAAQIAFAAEKWRLVELRFAGHPPPRIRAIAYSAMGTALGQFLPPPLANAVIRGAGNRLALGGGARRGALTSIWEQLFDLGVVAVLCLPAAVAIVLRSPLAFIIGAPLTAALVGLIVGPMVVWMVRMLRLPEPLANLDLTRRLYSLSLVRFVLLTLVTVAVLWAMGSSIDNIAMASIIPPVALGSVLSFLPAGLGVNEWSFVVLLGQWGVRLDDVATFAVVNRLVVGSTALCLGVVGAGALALMRLPLLKSA